MISITETWGASQITHPTTQGLRLSRSDDLTKYVELTVSAAGGLTLTRQAGQSLLLTDGTALDATYDLAAASILGLDLRATNPNTSGHYIATHLVAKQAVATSGSMQAFETFLYVTHTSGTVAAAYNQIANVLVNAPGGTVTNVYNRGGGLVMGAGTVGTYYGLSSGGPLILGGLGGTVTNAYGLWIGDVNQATTLNYAIYTNAGAVRFGGTVTAVGGLTITGGTAAAGTIYKSAAAGLVQQAITGSSYDWTLANPTNTGTYLVVPTGTLDILFGGGITISSGSDLKLGRAASASVATPSTHKIQVKDSAGATYYLLATT